jgi:hypothetical protein
MVRNLELLLPGEAIAREYPANALPVFPDAPSDKLMLCFLLVSLELNAHSAEGAMMATD